MYRFIRSFSKAKIKPIETAGFTNSIDYWKNRYESGRNSGSGSYNNLAVYKGEILNNFLQKHKINSVIELGCGDGNQLKYFQFPKYIGFDISDYIIEKCREIFRNDSTKIFLNLAQLEGYHADLVISLDVIYHLIEDDIFENYMISLFNCSDKFVIIYSCNFIDDGTYAPHVKPREFTQWITLNIRDFLLIRNSK